MEWWRLYRNRYSITPRRGSSTTIPLPLLYVYLHLSTCISTSSPSPRFLPWTPPPAGPPVSLPPSLVHHPSISIDFFFVGPGAAGRITDGSNQRYAFSQLKNPTKWMDQVLTTGFGTDTKEQLSKKERIMVSNPFGCRENLQLETVSTPQNQPHSLPLSGNFCGLPPCTPTTSNSYFSPASYPNHILHLQLIVFRNLY